MGSSQRIPPVRNNVQAGLHLIGNRPPGHVVLRVEQVRGRAIAIRQRIHRPAQHQRARASHRNVDIRRRSRDTDRAIEASCVSSTKGGEQKVVEKGSLKSSRHPWRYISSPAKSSELPFVRPLVKHISAWGRQQGPVPRRRFRAVHTRCVSPDRAFLEKFLQEFAEASPTRSTSSELSYGNETATVKSVFFYPTAATNSTNVDGVPGIWHVSNDLTAAPYRRSRKR